MNKYFAEGVGAFALVFMGAGAAVVNSAFSGRVTHVGVALVFGLVVLAVIYAIGDVSGAHINPAVTVGFWASGRLPGSEVAPYITAQCLGALGAALTHRLLFSSAAAAGVTRPVIGLWESFVLELILTWFLMFVIVNVSTGAKEKGITAGIAVGAVIGLEALFAGPATGASMNPARSLGPAVINLDFSALWLYLIAPALGAWLGVHTFHLIHPECAPKK